MSNQPSDHLDVRIAKVEQAYGTLHADVAGLKSQMEDLGKSISSEFKALRNEQIRASHTNWPTVFGGIALLMTVVGGLWAMAIQPVANQMVDVRGQIADVRRTEYMRISYEHMFVKMLANRSGVDMPDIPSFMPGSESR